MRQGGDDGELVSRAQAGDLDAFGALVERHTAAVYRVALRMLGDPDDAEDTAQDTFLEAWRSLDGFRGDSALSTWLYRIVMNRCLRALRRRRDAAPLPERLVSTAPGPERVAEARTQVERLRSVLANRLTPEQRAALVLRELEGCSYEEIATILQTTVPAVKGRVHRGRVEVLSAMRGWT